MNPVVFNLSVSIEKPFRFLWKGFSFFRQMVLVPGFIFLLICGYFSVFASERARSGYVFKHEWLYVDSYLMGVDVFVVDFLFGVVVYFLFRSFFSRILSFLFSCLFLHVFAEASRYKMASVGLPILPWDVWFFKDLSSISGFVGVSYWVVVFVFVLFCFLLFVVNKKTTPCFRSLCGVVLGVACSFVVFYFFLVLVALPRNPVFLKGGVQNIVWDHGGNFSNYGPYYSFVANVGYFNFSPLTDGDLRRVKEIDSRSLPEVAVEERPDVVVILSESFTDLPLKVYGGAWSCLPVERISKFVSPVWGGMTANAEFEVLTGYPSAVFPTGSIPFQMYLKRPLDNALPTVFSRSGYETIALHTFERRFFSRDVAYPVLGFDFFKGLEDFDRPLKRGMYVDDQVLFDEIFHRLSEYGRYKFIHAVSMMAHLPYDWSGRYPVRSGLKGRIPAQLSAYETSVSQYSSMILDHEEMLCDFIDKIKKLPRRVVLVFYGDHYPALGADSFYRDLYGFLGGGLKFDLYRDFSRTPFFVFDSRRGFVSGSEEIYPYSVGSAVLDFAGIKKTGVWAMDHKVSGRKIVGGVYDSSRYILGGGGRFVEDSEFSSLRSHAYHHLLGK